MQLAPPLHVRLPPSQSCAPHVAPVRVTRVRRCARRSYLAMPGRSPHCRRCWAGSACNQHNAPPQQLTGRRGRCWRGRARPRRTMRGRETGRMDGRCARRESSTLTSASARCCLTCRPVLKHCCDPRQDRRQVLGSLRSQPSRPPRSHRPLCRSLWGVACDNLCLCTATPAGRPMAAAAQLTASAITHSRARAQDSSPGGLRSWSEPGCGSPGKRWGRKGKSFGPHDRPACRNAGPSQARPRRGRGAEQRGSAVLRRHACVPLARSGHPQPCAAAVDGAVLHVAERRKRAAYPELYRAGRAADAGCARLRGGGPLERPGPQLLARPGAFQGIPRPSSRARGSDCRLGAALVEHADNSGAAGSRQYGSGRRLAAAAGRRGPAARQHPPPRRPRGPQPPALAALAKDREGAAAAGLSGGSGRSKETSPAGRKRRVKKKKNKFCRIRIGCRRMRKQRKITAHPGRALRFDDFSGYGFCLDLGRGAGCYGCLPLSADNA